MADLSGFLYKCSAGETFDSVALNIYDHEKYASDLMNANPGYVHLAVFVGGEVLALPVVEIMEGESENEYAPSTAPWKG